MSSTSLEPKTLYVSNINYNTVEKSLIDLFSKYGKVNSARIIKRKYRGEIVSLGLGFVEFAEEKEMQSALEAFKESRKNGAPIKLDSRNLFVQQARVRPERKRDTHFISGIPDKTTVEDLMNAFKPFNPINAKIVKTNNDKGKGFAFVQLASTNDREAAIKAGTSIPFNGEESIVRVAHRDFESKRTLRRRRFRHTAKKQDQ